MTSVFAILIAGIISTGIGFVWYHPKAFGVAWMRLSGITPEQASGPWRKWWVMIAGFLAMLVMVSILHLQTFAEEDFARAMMHTGWLWLGFVAPVLLGSVLWEHKSPKLFLINGMYWLVAMLSITIVLQIIP